VYRILYMCLRHNYVCVYMHVCFLCIIYTNECVHACIISVYVRVRMFMHVYTRNHILEYTCTCTPRYISKCIHAYTHTHTYNHPRLCQTKRINRPGALSCQPRCISPSHFNACIGVLFRIIPSRSRNMWHLRS
jgi:hypothetical protein